jgi:hypothetical protein
MQRVVVLLKYLILLALLAPFGLVCYLNGRALLELFLADAASPPAAADVGRLKETGEAAKKLSDSLREARDTIVCVAEKDDDARAEADSPGARVRTAAARRAADLRNTRRLLEATAGGDVDALFPDKAFTGHPYREYLVKRNKDSADAGGRLARAKEAARALQQEFDAGLKKAAERSRYDRDALAAKIKGLQDRLRECAADSKSLGKEDVTWVKRQVANWNAAADMLALADQVGNLTHDDTADVNDLLERHENLHNKAGEEALSPEFKALVRGTARRLARNWLPRPPLPYDKWVKVGAGEKVVEKDELGVKFEASGDKVRFKDSGYDEFTLQPLLDKGEEYPTFWLYKEGRGQNGPLKPAPKSVAARDYNKWHETSKWDNESLRALRKICDTHKDLLGDLTTRLEKLLEAVNRHEDLFLPEK